MTGLPGNPDRIPRPTLLDATGRRIMELMPGANDVRHLAPGVYFVRGPKTGDGRPRTEIHKIVVGK